MTDTQSASEAPQPLRFRKAQAGRYTARSETKDYTVYLGMGTWYLVIRALTTTAGVIHALGTPVLVTDQHGTKALCVAVAREFHALGDDYKPHEHGNRERYTEAVGRAYDADKAARA